MPRLNGLGQAAMGVAGGPGSIDGRIVATPGGDICWVDDTTIALQTVIGGVWTLVLIDTRNGEVTVPAPARGANQIVAGGGRWAAFLASTPSLVYGALGELPGASLYDAGPDGTIAWKRVYQASAGLTLTTPGGAVVDVPDALPLDVQVIGAGQAVWQDLRGLRAIGVTVPTPAAVPGRLRRVDVVGEIWLVYWAEGIGLVAQVDGASDGYILETRPIAFNHDAVCANGALVVAWSTTQGEAPGDLVTVTVDRTQPRVPIVAPVTFAFDHPVLVCPFMASGSGQPDVFTLGTYSEAPDAVVTPPVTGRLVLAHDGASDWTPPAGLRPFDLVLVELYRTTAETLLQSAARWVRQVQAVVHAWPGDVGVIPQFYDQGGIPGGNPPELWTPAQVLEGLTYLSSIANLSPRIKVIAPFAYNRGNGIVAHPELQTAFAALVSAAQAAGAATLTPIPSPTPVPVPTPAPAPMPPAPEFSDLKGPSMSFPKNVALVGPGGDYASVDPGTKLLTFNRTQAQAWETFVLDLIAGDGRQRMTLVPTSYPDHCLSIDVTQYGSDSIKKLFALVPLANRGNYESFDVRQDSLTGLLLAFISYIDQGVVTKPFVSPNLTVVEL